jgi:hypothetical protein
MKSLQQSRRHRLKDVSNFTPGTELVAKAAFDLDCDEIPESDQRVAGTLQPYTAATGRRRVAVCMTTMEAHSEASTIKPQIQFGSLTQAE